MSEENEDTFDIDSGVADIADGLGFDTSEDVDFDDETEESDSEGDEESEQVEEGKKDGETETTEETKPPPQSWAKEKHEAWNKIPDDAKEYIELREKQMLDGIEQYKQGHQYANAFAQALEPFRQDIALTGVDEVTAVKALLTHHRALTNGTLEQRQKALLEIGYASGIIPKIGQTEADLERQQLQMQLHQRDLLENQRQQQYIAQQQQQIAQSVTTFASDPKHEYFDEVADDIVGLLQAGYDLNTAYEKAVWANPVTRAKEIAKTQQQNATANAEKAKAEALKAKKASSTNIRTSNGRGRAPAQPSGSWEDTMNETLQRIKSR